MPLLKGSSEKAIAENISRLHKENKNKPDKKKRGHDQIIAIALSIARRSKNEK